MAVVSAVAGIRLAGLLHPRLCSARAKSLAVFYETALGFRQVAMEHLSGARALERFGVAGRALRITLELGAQTMKLLQFVDDPGRDYPVDSIASDLVFQHFAIVVDDMTLAMARLSQVPGWKAITRGGPQKLPASSGGVTAFKFRDPEGHPLELLAFPTADTPTPWRRRRAGSPFLGIDHSAISVTDGARSAAFYQSLGLRLSGQSLNDDPAQARLDGIDHSEVKVIAMAPARATPHVEFLCYHDAVMAGQLDLRANDVAATCLVFEPDEASCRPQACFRPVHDLLDPDGHRLAIVWPER